MKGHKKMLTKTKMEKSKFESEKIVIKKCTSDIKYLGDFLVWLGSAVQSGTDSEKTRLGFKGNGLKIRFEIDGEPKIKLPTKNIINKDTRGVY